jgi:hypothetical protein
VNSRREEVPGFGQQGQAQELGQGRWCWWVPLTEAPVRKEDPSPFLTSSNESNRSQHRKTATNSDWHMNNHCCLEGVCRLHQDAVILGGSILEVDLSCLFGEPVMDFTWVLVMTGVVVNCPLLTLPQSGGLNNGLDSCMHGSLGWGQHVHLV